MARKKKAGKPSSPYCTFPSLHSDVSALLEEDDLYFGFRDGDDPEGCLKHYDTKIMGRFVCHNDACSCKGWGSQKIAITIRMYPGADYNARVYNQRCKRCETLGEIFPDQGAYAERVAYRIKKWCGVPMQPPAYAGRKQKGPHLADLCEGCKDGHCTEGGLE